MDVNPAFELYIGLKKADLIGHTLLEIMPESQHGFIHKFSEAVLSGKPMHVDYYFETLQRHICIHFFNPQRGLLATIFEDVSQRKQAEQSLLSAKEYTRNGLDLPVWG